MKPTIALVGRPNVGKSTLFNRLTRTKDALVHDLPGLTRDRHYGHGKVGSKPYLVIDTGGFEPVVDSGILHEMAKQTLQAVDEADAVVFLVDGRTGLTPQDKIIADRLRQSPRPVYLAVNKGEGGNRAVLAAEFYELALGDPYVISGAHGDGVYYLIEDILETFPEPEKEEEEAKHPVFAVIGRPNVGKSTLVNAILGEERVIAFDMAGTTRDSIHIDFEREGKPFTIMIPQVCAVAAKWMKRWKSSPLSKPCRRLRRQTLLFWCWMRNKISPTKMRRLRVLLWKQAVPWWWRSINGTASAKSVASK